MNGEEKDSAETDIDVVVRCRNEMPFARRCLAALAAQRGGVRARVLFLDCGSGDGSREEAQRAGVRLLDVDPAGYVPGAVLNRGMERTRSPVVAFVNADAVALGEGALAALVAPLLAGAPEAGASFARQVPRPDADALTRADYARAFGPAEPQRVRRGEFFSMAASAVRRACWERVPFDPALAYSEDVDWVRRCGALGWGVAYAPGAVFEHSHAYGTAAHFRRRRGEGRADRVIFRLGERSLTEDLLRPLAGSVLRDAREGRLGARGLLTRVAQSAGYFAGRR